MLCPVEQNGPSRLYDELEGKLRALESLGRTQERFGDFPAPLVESRLPEEVLMTWERNRNHYEPSDNTAGKNIRSLGESNDLSPSRSAG
ncbi:hypothetical protein TNCV_2880731 [Trichonephila clavipes]|nr:hypothetical protein TNCV_2880731 [Trichonephila clavipes]